MKEYARYKGLRGRHDNINTQAKVIQSECTHRHRLIGTASLLLAIPALPLQRRSTSVLLEEGIRGKAHLLAPATLERVRLRLLLARAERFEQVLLHDLRVRPLPLLRGHVLGGHPAELRHGEVPGDHALSKAGVILVFEIDEQRPDLRLVRGGRPPIVAEDRLLDVLGATENELARCGDEMGDLPGDESGTKDIRAPESKTSAS